MGSLPLIGLLVGRLIVAVFFCRRGVLVTVLVVVFLAIIDLLTGLFKVAVLALCFLAGVLHLAVGQLIVRGLALVD